MYQRKATKVVVNRYGLMIEKYLIRSKRYNGSECQKVIRVMIGIKLILVQFFLGGGEVPSELSFRDNI